MLDRLQTRLDRFETDRAQARKMGWRPAEVWETESLQLKTEEVEFFLARNNLLIAEPAVALEILVWLQENDFEQQYQKSLQQIFSPDSYGSPITHLSQLVKYAVALDTLGYEARLKVIDSVVNLLTDYSKQPGQENIKLLTTLFWNFLYQDLSDAEKQQLHDDKVKGSRFMNVDAYISSKQSYFTNFAKKIGQYVFSLEPTSRELDSLVDISNPSKGVYLAEIMAEYYRLVDKDKEGSDGELTAREKLDSLTIDDFAVFAKQAGVLQQESYYLFEEGMLFKWEAIARYADLIRVESRVAIGSAFIQQVKHMREQIQGYATMDITRTYQRYDDREFDATYMTNYIRTKLEVIQSLYDEKVIGFEEYAKLIEQLSWDFYSLSDSAQSMLTPAMNFVQDEIRKNYEIA